MTKKLLIVEEALRDLKAHWFEYIKTIQQAANDKQWEVEVVAHKDAAPEIINQLHCYPLFKKARYLTRAEERLPGERYYDFVLHSIRCLRVLWPFFKKHHYDLVFVPTVLVHHLLAWYFIMRRHPAKPARLTLFFVMPPGEWNPDKQITTYPRLSIITKKLLRLFKPFVEAGTVTLAVETQEAKKQFETLSGLPFTLMPHPVPYNQAASNALTAAEITNNNNEQQTVSFGCFGFARHEKGSDLLKAAIEKILRDDPDFRGHFTIQWTDAFSMPDGTVCTPGPVLENHPQVTIINKAIDSLEYEKLLLKTNCMILPYRNSSYQARVSRVAIEAACNGIPIIYTKAGWLEENVENFGAGLGVKDESLDELVTAIQTLYSDIKEFSKLAEERKYKARAYYSPDHFFKILLAPQEISN